MTYSITTRVNADLLASIDSYRRGEADIPSRPEAIRRLLATVFDAAAGRPFDRVAYQREYMRKRRAAQKSSSQAV